MYAVKGVFIILFLIKFLGSHKIYSLNSPTEKKFAQPQHLTSE